MGESARSGVPPFLRGLDEGPSTRRQCILLVGVAAALAWYWLPGIALAFVRPIIEGQHTTPSLQPGQGILLRSLLANGIIAFAVGALGGSGVRRFRWAVGPALLVLVAAYDALAAASIGQRGMTVPGRDAAVPVQMHLTADPITLTWLFCLLACAAVGGHLAPRVFRRLPLRFAVTGALGWVCVAFVAYLVQQIWSSRYYNTSYSEWSMADLALKAPRVLPYILGGAWMRWAMRGGRLWTGAVVVGAAAAIQAFRGSVVIGTAGFLSAVLLYGSWCLQPIVWAAAGAWVTGLVLGLGPQRELVKQALGVAVAAAVAVATGLLASSLQVGMYNP